MPFSVFLNGTEYFLPSPGDKTAWASGPSSNGLNAYLAALASSSSSGVISSASHPAAAGVVRLANTDVVAWRNAANSGDLPLGVNATTGALTYNGVDIPGTASAVNPVAIYKGASQSFTSGGAAAQVNFSASEVDTHSAVTTGASWKFTVPTGKDGIYRVGVTISASGAIGSGTSSLVLYKNGVQFRDMWASLGAVPASQFMVGYTELGLVATDFIDVRFSQSSGSTVSLLTGGPSPNTITIGRNSP